MNVQLPPQLSVENTSKYRTVFHLFVVLAVAAGFVMLPWIDTIPDRVDDQQTVLVGTSRLTPDSDASMRVVVQDVATGRPVDGAQVEVDLKPAKGLGKAISLFEGKTDEAGTAPVRFHVPTDAPTEARLVVKTRSDVGRDRVEKPVTIEREYRLLLTTDKPLYQPGQTIHLRALALSTFDQAAAANATVDFLVEDPKGNKVFRDSVTTSEFGVASADFTLADLVNQGDYKLSASIEETTSEKTVEVRPYVLPKFGVDVSTDRSFYLPGQRVEGVVQADYFFGKPVTEGEVKIVGSVWDVGRTVVLDLQGQTDEAGSYEFSFDLPQYLAGSGLESGQARFALEVTVVDQTDHAEQVSQVLPVAAQPLIIEAIPEAGVLKPGVENVIYVLTSYPDGRPAPATLDIRVDDGDILATIRRDTNAFGLAEFVFTPSADRAGASHSFEIFAQNEKGESAHRQITLESAGGADNLLLRSDRAAYTVGETMDLTALTTVRSGAIYLDVVKAGQTLSTRSASVQDGDTGLSARFAVDVTPEMYGEVELHAYKVLLDGTIVRDTRLVAVDAPTDLSIDIDADQEIYLPGDTAEIGFDVGGQEGAGVPAALGVAVVDESVFALQRQDPGFAKLYFLLRQELMEPFDLHEGFELPASRPLEGQSTALRQAQDTAAKASWASVPAATSSHSTSSYQEKVEAARQRRQKGFEYLGQASSVVAIVIPVGLWVIVLIALGQIGLVKRSLKRLGIISVILLLVGGSLVYRSLNMMPYYVEPGAVLIPLAAAFGLVVLALVGYAWTRRDPTAKTLVLLTLAWAAVLFLLVRTADRGNPPAPGLVLAGLLAYSLLPGAYLLFGQGRWLQGRRIGGALVTGLGALSALPAMGLLLTIPAITLSGRLPIGAPAADLAPQPGLQALGDTGGMWEVEKETIVEEATEEPPAGDGADGQKAASEAPHLRQWFPETLYWAPDVRTDDRGHTAIEIPMADSITTWRLTALASSRDGRLGFATHGLRVFQDFFVDIDLPVSLTEGDEISIPVGVFNYLPDAQEVRLVVEGPGDDQDDWFELLGEAERTLTIDSNDIEVVYFPIRVLEFGRHSFQVTAWGSQMSDAIRREVDVVPNGKQVRLTKSDWLREDREVELEVPPKAVPGASRVEVKIYPGVLAQVVEGLEKILRLPHG